MTKIFCYLGNAGNILHFFYFFSVGHCWDGWVLSTFGAIFTNIFFMPLEGSLFDLFLRCKTTKTVVRSPIEHFEILRVSNILLRPLFHWIFFWWRLSPGKVLSSPIIKLLIMIPKSWVSFHLSYHSSLTFKFALSYTSWTFCLLRQRSLP
jgi:hypothetical protein